MTRAAVPPFVLVHLKRATGATAADGRHLRRHGVYGNVHAVRPATALRLVDTGLAKLLPQFRLPLLREHVEASQCFA